jgi:hypothetical protein
MRSLYTHTSMYIYCKKLKQTVSPDVPIDTLQLHALRRNMIPNFDDKTV